MQTALDSFTNLRTLPHCTRVTHVWGVCTQGSDADGLARFIKVPILPHCTRIKYVRACVHAGL